MTASADNASGAISVNSDRRGEQRLAWARAATGVPELTLQRASVDAGFRSYWRTRGGSRTQIVMDSPPDLEDVRPWLAIRTLLERGDVRVPAVLVQDEAQGFLLLEDLGVETLLHVIGPDNADALFDDAVTQLLKLQAIAPPADLPAYDEQMLARELRLFDEWFLVRHLGLTLGCDDLERLDLVQRRLIDNALTQRQLLVHRDFMPRNLMPVAGGPAVIDFQGAVRGPVAYDALSLFKDAFVSWPQARVDGWMERYHARAVDAGIPLPSLARFRRDADFIGVQRHLKILGIFARLQHRDDKPNYLPDAPRFLAYLDGVAHQYPELQPLAELLHRRVRPALAERHAAERDAT